MSEMWPMMESRYGVEEFCTSDSDDSGRVEMYDNDYFKTINDCVHSLITFEHPLLMAIIDTPEFQRLRHIKQCGPCFYVYPTAVHSRFEHCLGVYHVAKKMIEVLLRKGANITVEERLCLQIAALCHDLGHGPYSHTWERVIKVLTKQSWKHEAMSLKVLNYMLDQNNGALRKLFEESNLSESHIHLIEDLIMGKPRQINPEKAFLFEIVANRKTGIDVDRLEYIMRDAHQFGVGGVDVNYDRIISEVELKKDGNNEVHLVYRDKLMSTILEMFESRVKMHRKCYQHRVCKIIECMVIDAMEAAGDYHIVSGVPLKRCHERVDSFLKITDHIFPLIEYSDDPQLTESRELLQRITTRDLYSLVGDFLIEKPLCKLLNSSLEQLKYHLKGSLSQTDFSLGFISLSIGPEGRPLENIPFYSKKGDDSNLEDRIRRAEISRFYNWTKDSELSTTQLLILSRVKIRDSDNLRTMKEAVEKFTKEYLNTL